MRAILFKQFGEPAEVLKLDNVAVAEPRPGEIRVRMLASPINPSDLMTVRGNYGRKPQLPATPGFEGVGVVESNGGGFWGRYLLGKRVAVLNRKGGNWCETVVLPANQTIPVSADLPVEQTAMFFVNPATALVMTRTLFNVPAGAWLLQTAAGSALGRMVIRLGKHYGFRTLNVVRREAQIEELKELGGNAVLAYDPSKQSADQLRGEVLRITEDRGVPFVIDPVGGAVGSAVAGCLAPQGRMLVYGTLTDDPLTLSPRLLISPEASISGFWLARWMQRQSVLTKLRLVKSIGRLMRQGVLISDIGGQFQLEDVSEAVRAAETTGRSGKVLLRMADE
jgi:NADPH:quinone reductase-like Zn-dependent oxidoreductase